MGESILRVVRRKGKIAPFINGWNVWDIEEKHWTKDVKDAILHAYELGWKHALDKLRRVPDLSLNTTWPDVKDE